ncbi:MAG: GAF domain-containing protein, partial [Omnitrophica WOR_2 bacterium]
MADRASPYIFQLKETCKISGARWAAWVKRSPEAWIVQLQHGLNKQRQAELSRFILNPKTATWLAGTFSSGRTRSRQTGDSAELLGCQRLFAFPNIHTHTTLIVGADVLNKTSENFFRVLAFNIIPEESPELRLEGEDDEIPFSFTPFEIGREASYNLADVLANVLEYMVGSVACDSALMSIRSGEHLRIAAAWNIPTNALGKEVSIGEDEILSEIVTTRHGVIKDDVDSSETCLGLFQAQFPFSCLGIPVVIGKRVIGLLTFYSSQTGSFHPSDLHRVTLQSNRLAYVIENAIVFDEATRY